MPRFGTINSPADGFQSTGIILMWNTFKWFKESPEYSSASISWCYVWWNMRCIRGQLCFCVFKLVIVLDRGHLNEIHAVEKLLRGPACCSSVCFKHLIMLCWLTRSPVCDLCIPQLPEALQSDENQGSALVVQTDPERPPLPAHQSPSHHSQGPEMRQHLHHRAHGLGEDRGPGFSHAEEGLLCQERHR